MVPLTGTRCLWWVPEASAITFSFLLLGASGGYFGAPGGYSVAFVVPLVGTRPHWGFWAGSAVPAPPLQPFRPASARSPFAAVGGGAPFSFVFLCPCALASRRRRPLRVAASRVASIRPVSARVVRLAVLCSCPCRLVFRWSCPFEVALSLETDANSGRARPIIFCFVFRWAAPSENRLRLEREPCLVAPPPLVSAVCLRVSRLTFQRKRFR